MLDTLIAMLLLIYPITIFLAKGGKLALYSFLILLCIKVLKEKLPIGKIIVTLVFCIIGYNFIKIYEQKDQFGESLNISSISSYAIAMMTIIMIMYIFSDFSRIEGIYRYIYTRNIFVLFQVVISQIIIVILVVTGKGYQFTWEGKYFVGLFDTPHPYGYSMILMVIIVEWLYIIRKDYWIIGLNIVPIITTVLSGARTPTIILIFTFLMMRLMKKERNYKIQLFNLVLACIILTLIICFYKDILDSIMNSSFIQKFEYASSTGSGISSGRDKFWKVLINTYINEFSVTKKLFGNGIYSTMLINKSKIGLEIWAHSDFIDILISYGLVLFLIFVFFYTRFFYMLLINTDYKAIVITLFIGFIFISSMNGIVNYPNFIGVFCYVLFFTEALRNLKLVVTGESK
jgi:hypothetical protein